MLNNPLENLPTFPLCLREGDAGGIGHPSAYPLRVKREIGGDFYIFAAFKSPLTPLFKGGNTPLYPDLRLMDNLCLC